MDNDLVRVECPNCGKIMEMDKDRDFGFCLYCKTKIYVPDAVNETEEVSYSENKIIKKDNLFFTTKKSGRNELPVFIDGEKCGTIKLNNLTKSFRLPIGHHTISVSNLIRSNELSVDVESSDSKFTVVINLGLFKPLIYLE